MQAQLKMWYVHEAAIDPNNTLEKLALKNHLVDVMTHFKNTISDVTDLSPMGESANQVILDVIYLANEFEWPSDDKDQTRFRSITHQDQLKTDGKSMSYDVTRDFSLMNAVQRERAMKRLKEIKEDSHPLLKSLDSLPKKVEPGLFENLFTWVARSSIGIVVKASWTFAKNIVSGIGQLFTKQNRYSIASVELISSDDLEQTTKNVNGIELIRFMDKYEENQNVLSNLFQSKPSWIDNIKKIADEFKSKIFGTHRINSLELLKKLFPEEATQIQALMDEKKIEIRKQPAWMYASLQRLFREEFLTCRTKNKELFDLMVSRQDMFQNLLGSDFDHLANLTAFSQTPIFENQHAHSNSKGAL